MDASHGAFLHDVRSSTSHTDCDNYLYRYRYRRERLRRNRSSRGYYWPASCGLGWSGHCLLRGFVSRTYRYRRHDVLLDANHRLELHDLRFSYCFAFHHNDLYCYGD